jgi:thiol-disulfide isomerase/thioredoxin
MFSNFRHPGSAPLPMLGSLPGFDGATGWLNAEPLTADGLRGRVVLVQFWTYTCVNWLRTLPYVRAWNARYRDLGLTVVGAHTPEFGFERDVDNIRASLGWFGVDWPVAIDSNYGVWRAFNNHFWPAVYLADAEGQLRFEHFGEGEYAMTELAIKHLLMQAGAAHLDETLVSVNPQGLEVSANWDDVRSGESYTGYGQATGFASAVSADFDQPHAYVIPELRLNQWGLAGNWTVTRLAASSNDTGGRLTYRFHARDANLVMRPQPADLSIPFRVTLDGRPVGDAAGVDVDASGNGVLHEQRTYQLIRQRGPIDDRTFEIEFAEAGAEVYCFTFG